MKFDCIIANPPYQDSAVGQADKKLAYMKPLYHYFVKNAIDIIPADGLSVQIHPFRCFVIDTFNDWRRHVLPYIRYIKYYREPHKVFHGADIAYGVAIVYYGGTPRADGQYIKFINMTDYPDDMYDVPQDFIDKHNILLKSKYDYIIVDKIYKYGNMLYDTYNTHNFQYAIHNNTNIDKLTHSDTPKDGYIITKFSYDRYYYLKASECNHNYIKHCLNKYKVIIGKMLCGGTHLLCFTEPLDPGIANSASYYLLYACEHLDEAQFVNSYIHTRFIQYLIYMIKAKACNSLTEFKFVPDPFVDDGIIYKEYKKQNMDIAALNNFLIDKYVGDDIALKKCINNIKFDYRSGRRRIK